LEKDLEELVLIMKGNTPEYLLEESELLRGQIERQIQGSKSKLTIAVGSPKQRLADLYQSFIEALVNIQNTATPSAEASSRIDKAELLKIDKAALEDYLKSGVKTDFEHFFDTHIRPIGETACKSSLIKSYIFMDLVLATAKFVNELGGSIDQIIPDLNRIGAVLAGIKTIDQIRAQAQEIIFGALAFRDSRTTNQYDGMIRQSKDYIALHYHDSDLSLNRVAAQANLSPCHFSAVFSQETGTTFKEYLTEIRISKAKELLRTTPLRSSEISEQVGYNDPHYFSYVFRKSTRLSPKEFRAQVPAERTRAELVLSN
jgi:two-component system, response regulator YesN